jgi:hypothetical protein
MKKVMREKILMKKNKKITTCHLASFFDYETF